MIYGENTDRFFMQFMQIYSQSPTVRRVAMARKTAIVFVSDGACPR
jgi:hypothetical protein